METNLEALLRQIRKEGFDEAEEIAQEVKDRANQSAKETLKKAEIQSKQLLEKAQQEVELKQKSFQEEMQLAFRDLLLQTKKEVDNLFQNILQSEIEREYQHNLKEIILKLVDNWLKNQNDNSMLEIFLEEQEISKINDYLLTQIKEKFEKGISLKIHPKINSGFRVSTTETNGYFDFEAKTLSEFLMVYLSPDLQKLLQSSVGKKE